MFLRREVCLFLFPHFPRGSSFLRRIFLFSLPPKMEWKSFSLFPRIKDNTLWFALLPRKGWTPFLTSFHSRGTKAFPVFFSLSVFHHFLGWSKEKLLSSSFLYKKWTPFLTPFHLGGRKAFPVFFCFRFEDQGVLFHSLVFPGLRRDFLSSEEGVKHFLICPGGRHPLSFPPA